MIPCPVCDREISPNAQFCPQCGQPIRQQPSAARAIAFGWGLFWSIPATWILLMEIQDELTSPHGGFRPLMWLFAFAIYVFAWLRACWVSADAPDNQDRVRLPGR